MTPMSRPGSLPPPSPEEEAPWLQRPFFHWVTPLVKQGAQRPLQDTDLLPLNRSEDTFSWAKAFAETLPAHLSARWPIFATLWALFKKDYAVVLAFALVNVLCALSVPLFIREVMAFLGDNSRPLAVGLAAAFALFTVGLAGNVVLHHLFHRTLKLGMRYRAALVVNIYRKSLRLSPAARRSSSTGEIVNLMSIDAANIYNVAPVLHQLVVMPLQLILASVLLYALLGVSSFAGLAVMILMLPVSARMAKRVMMARMRLVSYADERVSLVSEILAGIRVIKYYAWERSFLGKVAAVRSKEQHELMRVALLSTWAAVMFLATPIFVGVATFSVHLGMGKTLRAPEVFAALAVFGILRPVMSQLPFVFSSLVSALVSEKRIVNFLAQTELSPRRENTQLAAGTVRFEDFEASWNQVAFRRPSQSVLSQVRFAVEPGELVAIVGSVGSGKSSLLSAILGDLEPSAGRLESCGALAYVPQQAWIVNATLRENVVFGRPFQRDRYLAVLAACQLEDDLAHLPAGDSTEIGERGVNLSGGQKQRVCLARALYGEADIFLLDDTLSALDNTVGAEVFRSAVLEHLSSKTRFLVTHRLEYAKQAHKVVFLSNGTVVEQGSVKELLASKGAFFQALVQYESGHGSLGGLGSEGSFDRERLPKSRPQMESLVRGEDAAEVREQGRLVVDEEKATGSVRSELYSMYLGLLSPRGQVALLLLAFGVREVLATSNDAWLAWYSSDANQSGGVPVSVSVFVALFAVLGFFAVAATFLRSWLTWKGGVRAALVLHERLLLGVMRAPVSFFDSTPTGRILNRFGKDTEAVDQYLPDTYLDALGCAFTIFTTLVVVVSTTPWTLLAVVPLGFFYFNAQKKFRLCNREVKKLENISRSPLYAHFSETLAGVSVIRAFGAQERFVGESVRRFLGNQRSFYTMISLNRWLGTRLELIGAAVALSAALFAVLGRGSVNTALAGVSVTYAFLVTGALNWAVRMLSEIESNMNSVERVTHYAEVPSERWQGFEPPAAWPTQGQIEFRSLVLRYREDLDPVLRGFSLSISSGETIGIVGRTGAGKSTLFGALFRFIEASEGSVFIDGIDIRDVSLDALRSRLAIIPQDPVLFAGTLRRNLDPFDEHTNEELQDVLEKAGLSSLLSSPVSDPLSSPVEEGGANLSVGERQLVCLARALLRRVRILLMDEATAHVDFDTDALIHCTVREHFRHCTVLVIAHRIGTVMSADRVVVLERGRLAEVGSPQALLEKPGGVFRALAKDS